MSKGTGTLLTPPMRHWECPCGATAVTRADEAHARLHPCRDARGLLVPYAPVGAGPVKVTAHLREDYERHGGLQAGMTETLTRDDAGRPAMRTSIEYGDGQQAHAIFAPGINLTIG